MTLGLTKAAAGKYPATAKLLKELKAAGEHTRAMREHNMDVAAVGRARILAGESFEAVGAWYLSAVL